jgi:hypothetical protein
MSLFWLLRYHSGRWFLDGSKALGIVWVALDHKNSIFLAYIATVGLALGGLLGSLKPYVLEGKTPPNQEVRLSFKMALLINSQAVWLIAIGMAFYLLFFSNRLDITEDTDFISSTDCFDITNYRSVLNTSLRVFCSMFTIIFFWYGGLDVIKHYILLTLSG